MSSVTRPRGPLPPRVYWTRRVLVLVLALLLVFGISRLLGSSPDGGGGPQAREAAAPASSDGTPPASAAASRATPHAPAAAAGSTPPTSKNKRGKHASAAKTTPTKTPLPTPTGTCDPGDVTVRPAVDNADAGGEVTISLVLTTLTSPACTWRVSPDSVVLKLTSGSDRVWSSQDCPKAIKPQSVVVRAEHKTTVDAVWSGRRSDDECSRSTEWAETGYYHAVAAALGGDPTDTQFRLGLPPRPTVTRTASPQPGKTQTSEEDKSGSRG